MFQIEPLDAKIWVVLLDSYENDELPHKNELWNNHNPLVSNRLGELP